MCERRLDVVFDVNVLAFSHALLVISIAVISSLKPIITAALAVHLLLAKTDIATVLVLVLVSSVMFTRSSTFGMSSAVEFVVSIRTCSTRPATFVSNFELSRTSPRFVFCVELRWRFDLRKSAQGKFDAVTRQAFRFMRTAMSISISKFLESTSVFRLNFPDRTLC